MTGERDTGPSYGRYSDASLWEANDTIESGGIFISKLLSARILLHKAEVDVARRILTLRRCIPPCFFPAQGSAITTRSTYIGFTNKSRMPSHSAYSLQPQMCCRILWVAGSPTAEMSPRVVQVLRRIPLAVHLRGLGLAPRRQRTTTLRNVAESS